MMLMSVTAYWEPWTGCCVEVKASQTAAASLVTVGLQDPVGLWLRQRLLDALSRHLARALHLLHFAGRSLSDSSSLNVDSCWLNVALYCLSPLSSRLFTVLSSRHVTV